MTKSRYIKSLCLGFALLFAGFTAKAQQVETSIFLNGTLPMAQFNDNVNLVPFDETSFHVLDRSQIGKGAACGLGATARFGLWFDVGVGELQPFAEISFLWNNSGPSIRKAYDSHADSLNQYPTAPQYLNLPVMLGLKYRYKLMPDLQPFAELANMLASASTTPALAAISLSPLPSPLPTRLKRPTPDAPAPLWAPWVSASVSTSNQSDSKQNKKGWHKTCHPFSC